MKFPIWLVLIGVCVGLGAVLVIGQFITQPNLPLILDATFDNPTISPNADGEADITTFRYALSRNATISLTLTREDGTIFVFRDNEARIKGDYAVLFSGIVDGYSKPDENLPNTIERRLLDNGTYTWTLTATESDNTPQTTTGTLVIENADTPLPLISSFSVGPTVFSPNQDGIADRVDIEVYLEKEADLRVFLLDANGIEIPISARKEGRKEGEAGRHIFDYEGGVDLGADPPADGTYQVFAVAQDAVGQRVSISSELTIVSGGKPLAEIAPQSVGVDVVFAVMPYNARYFSNAKQLGELVAMPDNSSDLTRNAITMVLGDMLVFKLTVENYNDVPIRTTFPPPGTVYQQTQMSASLGAYDSSGAWRVGIQCETSTVSFPYRWALGDENTLLAIPDPKSGDMFYYLPPQSRAVVWGAIRFTDIEQRQNPQTCWAGLIQEDVEVSLRNSYVGAREIELVDPNATANQGN
jgi:hypothetical protein